MADKPTQRPPTWLEVAVGTGGFRKGIKALVWAQVWGIARAGLGHDPSVDEVADWWRASRRTTFREQAAFRECFPMLDSPAPIVDDPEVRRAHARAAKASADLDDAIRQLKQRKPPSDASVLTLGMRPAIF